jgi:protein-glutamine gamma-glutamyltransferase
MADVPSRLPATPPLVLAAALLIWGWQTGSMPLAIACALLLEAPRFLHWRWDLQDRDFNRLADITTVLFLVVVIYQFTDKSVFGIYAILQTMPMVLLPLVAAQKLSSRGWINLSALFAGLRRQARNNPGMPVARLDLSYPYLVLILLAASTGDNRLPYFIFIVGLLIGISLWPLRARRVPVMLWLALFACVLGTAYFTQQGMYRGQMRMERLLAGVFVNVDWTARSAGRTYTAIGHIGRLKLSERIQVRAQLPDDVKPPLLLREASYNVFTQNTWNVLEPEFEVIDPELGGQEWGLHSGRADRSIKLSSRHRREQGIIPLPHGAIRISDVTGFSIEQNQYGAVLLEARPGWVPYTVHYDQAALYDGPPVPADLEIPENFRPVLATVVKDLMLEGHEPAAVVGKVTAFFRDHFSYSLEQEQRFIGTSRLEDFLLHRRRGHCEYFATATALLLRATGIPTRYAVGYSLEEYSPLEGAYVARSRHAHSWVLAYVDGTWRVVDTTPAVWALLESEGMPWWQPLPDFIAFVGYYLSRAQAVITEDEEFMEQQLPWLLALLIVWLVWRTMRRRRLQSIGSRNKPQHQAGADTPFIQLLARLAGRGDQRQPGETLRSWLQRLDIQRGTPELQDLLQLHYRYRYDPGCDRDTLRRTLSKRVKQWKRSYK